MTLQNPNSSNESPSVASPSIESLTTTSSTTEANATEIPLAIVRRSPAMKTWFASKLWWITACCAVLSVGLAWYSQRQSGDLIAIGFRDGHGLKPEDRLRYHGIDVGAIEKIELNAGQDGVLVHLRLTPQARSMACEGAQFWIVRPSLSVDSIQGLDTIVGAKYIAIEPGARGARLLSSFEGLESPPIRNPPDGSLEITLDAESRGGLENGAPILFRGFRIGQVLQIGLASDARTVRARCAIDPEYRDLVRRNTRFWNRSGWRLDIGLTGIRLDADTLSQMMSGGVEMATPTDAEGGVSTGHRFVLHEKADPEWTKWKPALAHGPAWSRLESNMPQPVRTALRWQERSYGFKRNMQRFGWCLVTSEGVVICLSEHIDAPKSAIADTVVLEMGGVALHPQMETFTRATDNVSMPQTVRFTPNEPLLAEIARWPTSRIANSLPAKVGDVVIAHADAEHIFAIDAGRLRSTSEGWEIEDSVVLNADQNGLPVVSAESSQVIGILSIANKKRIIVGLQP